MSGPSGKCCLDCRKINTSSSSLFGLRPGGSLQKKPSTGNCRKRALLDGHAEHESPAYMEFKDSLHSLYESADNGCPCCSFLLRAVLQGSPGAYKGGRIRLVRHPAKGKVYERLAKGDYITLNDVDVELARFGIFSKGLEDSRDRGIVRRQVATTARNKICMEYIKYRLKDCELNHPTCAENENIYIPTRLLDISHVNVTMKRGKIRLITTSETPPSTSRYIALSHCWGGSSQKPPMVTSSTLESMKSCIPFSSLPSTFKDVVEITGILGFRYLWIDSLCILQDDAADWEAESDQMAEVYKHATLTVATSSSADSYQGILDQNRQLMTGSIRPSDYFTFPLSKFSEHEFGIMTHRVWAISQISEIINSHHSEPLSTRGWTLQERLLSRRTVFFDSSQLMWECRGGRYLEGWTLDIQLLTPPGNDPFGQVAKPSFLYPKSDNTQSQTTDVTYDWWYKMLAEYHSRKLTVSTDALPALSGLAREFSNFTGDEYLAGIWRGDLFRGLTWRRELEIDCGGTIAERHKRYIVDQKSRPLPIKDCFAPSWSWATISDRWRYAVRGDSWNGDVIRMRGHATSWKSLELLQTSEYTSCLQPRLIKADIISHGTNKTGHVSSATLTIEGACRRIVVTRRNLSTNHPYGQSPGLFIFELDDLEPKHLNQYLFPCVDHLAWLDEQLKQSEQLGHQVTLTCMLLGRSSGLHCLLLTETGNQTNPVEYYRCGVLNIEYCIDPFLDSWQTRTLALV